MAEQPTDITNQQPADDKEEETQSKAEDHVFGDGNKQEETVAALSDNQKHPESKQDKGDSASLSACTNSEMKSESREVLEPARVENTNTAEKKKAPPAEQVTSSGNKNSLTNTDSSVSPQPDFARHGRFNRDTQEKEQLISPSRGDLSGKGVTQETTSPQSDEDFHTEDGPKELDIEDSKETNNTNTEAERDVETIGPTSSETDCSGDTNTAEKKMVPPAEQLTSSGNKNAQTNTDSSVSPQPDDERHGRFNRDAQEKEQPIMKVDELSRGDLSEEMAAQEIISPQSDEDFQTEDGPKEVDKQDSKETNNANIEAEKDVETVVTTSSDSGGNGRYWLIFGLFFLVLAFVIPKLLHSESPPQKNDEQQVDIFLRQMEKVVTQFPNQRPELWKRSKIHLLRHLQTAQPTEPVSLILTAGLRAEKTLHCLAQDLAFAFSAALNASVLQIDGASKASQDSDLVKLDIDRNLQGAFEGDKPVAVIHRFEELPPGSTLIFYRYCDHENAAYKKTFLIFTVLLGEEEDIPAQSRLSAVEEMVDDHLQKKFLSDSHPVSYDKMDLDKYGGLWSRISHLILPVAAEKKLELHGCGRT